MALAEAILGFLGALLMIVAPARDQLRRLRCYRAREGQAEHLRKSENDIFGPTSVIAVAGGGEVSPPPAPAAQATAPSTRKKGLSDLFMQNAEAHEVQRNAWHPLDALTMAAGALLLALSFALRIFSLY